MFLDMHMQIRDDRGVDRRQEARWRHNDVDLLKLAAHHLFALCHVQRQAAQTTLPIDSNGATGGRQYRFEGAVGQHPGRPAIDLGAGQQAA
ncbi:MAG: hypothetical protein BWY63_01177 [Chloroflexi bacterium ADurb.Bin360]|nr:MAG: hypothetical protein BWY63_01177 [Chloroflexi bacterium ADurb.Bin360]